MESEVIIPADSDLLDDADLDPVCHHVEVLAQLAVSVDGAQQKKVLWKIKEKSG